MKYWQRKYHLKHTLPDGNIWNGFINIEADSKEDLPETVSGDFWVEKTEEGWHGLFELDYGEKHDKRKNPDGYPAWVLTVGVSRPDVPVPHRPTSREEAYEIMQNLRPVQYRTVGRFYDRLENCLTSIETHYW